MMNNEEPVWKDANPQTADLPNKGRTAILCLAGGIALVVFSFIGMRIRPLGLAVGVFALIVGISILLRRQKANFKTGLIVAAAGFLMLLANPRFGPVTGIAVFFLITGGIGLAALGLVKAVKLAWDLGRRS